MDLTTRLGLQKPDPDPVTGDFVDVQVLNDNADKIDEVISFTVCTNATRPSPPFAGQAILETDTGDFFVWGGSSWLPLAPTQLDQIGIGTPADTGNPLRKLTILSTGSNGSLSQVLLRQTGAAAASRALSTRGGGDTGDRFNLDFDGKMQWSASPGGTADVALFRGGANTLQTDDFLVSVRALAGDWSIGARITTDANPRFLAKADGRLEWGPGTSGSDTSLYRTAAGELTTPGRLVIGGDIDWNGATAVYATNPIAGTIPGTATTYVLPTTNTVGVAFVAPPSGKVKISWSSEHLNSITDAWTMQSPNVRAGNVIGSGSVILVANDAYSTRGRNNGTAGQGDKCLSNFYMMSGLTPGSSYNVQLYARVHSTGGTGTFEWQTIMVEPMI